MSSVPETVPIPVARAMLLACQGLDGGKRLLATRQGVLNSIRRMGQLQIDTISVVSRSPYLVLFSRIGPFEPAWLDRLLERGQIFEAWSHEACFLPREDYPIARARMNLDKPWKVRYRDFLEQNRAKADELIDQIRAHGPVRSADFHREPGDRGGWWADRKPEKDVLEALLVEGTVMIARRENFQRVYGLREQVMPEWDDQQALSEDAADRAMVLRTVKALGVPHGRWVADYYRMPVARAVRALGELASEGQLAVTSLDGLNGPAYVHPDNLPLLKRAMRGTLSLDRTVLLSPFDPVVWDRKRAEALFDFSYRIECYTPAPKRVYGYFSLPILHRGALVGRLDPKAHRATGTFEIKSLHLEPGFAATSEFAWELAQSVKEFSAWHQTPEVVVSKTTPHAFKSSLEQALR